MSREDGAGKSLQMITPQLSESLNAYAFTHRNTIAAGVASLASTIAGFPLDSVKSRLQVKRYSSVLDCVTKTYADEGVKGFFRGVTIPLVSITAVRTASFSIYSGVKEQLRSRQIITGHDVSSTAASAFIGGASSGIMLSIGTSAFEFAKIRSQLESIIAAKKQIPFVPRGTLRGILDMYRKGGMKFLYTGFKIHASRDTLGTGLYFCFYDTAQNAVAKNEDLIRSVPKFLTTFGCGSMAGIASWTVIYPIDLVKTKVQRNALSDSPYEKPWSIFRRLSAGGFTKLYRGLGVSAMRSVATHGLMWVVLESVRGEITRRTGHTMAEDAIVS